MKKRAFPVAVLLVLGALLVAALPAAASPGAQYWCKSWKESDPDAFYAAYRNIGDCVTDGTESAICHRWEHDNPDWFHAHFQSHGDCVNHQAEWNASWATDYCKSWAETHPETFYAKYKNIGDCVSSFPTE
jgi:hypothetical protein